MESEGSKVCTYEQEHECRVGEPDSNSFMSVDQEPKIVNLDEVKKKMFADKRLEGKNIKSKVIIRALIDSTGKFVKNIVLIFRCLILIN